VSALEETGEQVVRAGDLDHHQGRGRDREGVHQREPAVQADRHEQRAHEPVDRVRGGPPGLGPRIKEAVQDEEPLRLDGHDQSGGQDQLFRKAGWRLTESQRHEQRGNQV